MENLDKFEVSTNLTQTESVEVMNRLRLMPKTEQTMELLIEACKVDGLALKYATTKLINKNLCEIAVRQNGLALRYIPKRLMKANPVWSGEMYNIAVCSNGRALEFVPDELKSLEIIEHAISYYRKNSWIDLSEKEHGSDLGDYGKYPIFFVPRDMLNQEIIRKAISYSPFCIKDLDVAYLTEELVETALEINGMSLKYVPEKFITRVSIDIAINSDVRALKYTPIELIDQELCNRCFKEDYRVFPFIPEQYITQEMCLDTIKKKHFSVSNLPADIKEKYYKDRNKELIIFDDFPERFRNDKVVLDEIIENYMYGSVPLIEWNEDMKCSTYIKNDKRGNVIIPLRKETLLYLKNRIKEPEEKTEIISIVDNYLETMNNRIVLPLPITTSPQYMPTAYEGNGEIVHYFSDEESGVRFYYISDIHIEHQLRDFLVTNRKYKQTKSCYEKEKIIKEWMEYKIDQLLMGTEVNSVLLIGGDTCDSVDMAKIFYGVLLAKWKGTIISVLGNHELWDGTIGEDDNYDHTHRSADLVVEDYRRVINQVGYIGRSYLLENDVYIMYQNTQPRVINELDILMTTDKELKELFDKCSYLVVGGVGFSGLNPVYNAERTYGTKSKKIVGGLYRNTITSIQEDKIRTRRFRELYEKVAKCAGEKKIIVLTHMPTTDWTKEKLKTNCVYVNGHTHQNSILKMKDQLVVLADNQIGYKARRWKLNSFFLEYAWYDPFEIKENGIYEVTEKEYLEFNRGRGIKCEGCGYEGKIFMLKLNDIYMFLLQSEKSLCILDGGRRKKLDRLEPGYYFNNMGKYTKKIKELICPYETAIKEISREVKRFGGLGLIHGCIVDISWNSHIYLNPFDGKITPYWAFDTMSRLPFADVQSLLESKEPYLVSKFLLENEKLTIPILGRNSMVMDENKKPAVIPEWLYGNEIYKPSRIMKSVQYVWEHNVIRIWNEKVLNDNLDCLESRVKEKSLPKSKIEK